MTNKPTQSQIDEILDLHQKWLDRDPSGKRADLTGMDLSDMDFSNKNLYGTILTNANFSGANLTLAKINAADLCDAIFTDCIFTDANLKLTDFSDVNLNPGNLYQIKITHKIFLSAEVIIEISAIFRIRPSYKKVMI